MSKPIFVLGISFIKFGDQAEFAQLNVSRSLREVSTEKFKRRVIGESGEVNLQFDSPIRVEVEYARRLEKTGALVPRREYEVTVELNQDDPLSGSIVTSLIPVDAEIKKHFEASLGK